MKKYFLAFIVIGISIFTLKHERKIMKAFSNGQFRFLWMILSLVYCISLPAQTPGAPGQSLEPETLLQTDRFNSRMHDLIFADGDENWDSSFAALGLNGIVRAIAVSGDDVYIGGDFTMLGGMTVNHIARWNSITKTWSAMGGGVHGFGTTTIYAIATVGNLVYVGGAFAWAGDPPAPGTNPATRGIAVWNGSSWAPLGYGVGHGPHAIAVNGSDVYVGAANLAAAYNCDPLSSDTCRVVVSGIAKWDGIRWSNMGGGVSNSVGYEAVNAISASGNDVYVGGAFDTAGGVSANSIARWNDATNTWSTLGLGTHGNWAVNAIAVNGSDVYVGGEFIGVLNSDSTLVSAHHIAKWSNTTNTWSPLGEDSFLHNGLNGDPFALASHGSDIYVGGWYSAVYNSDGTVLIVNHIAKWSGANQAWSSLGSGTNQAVLGIAVIEDDVCVGGNFTMAGNKPSDHFGIWHTVLTSIDENIPKLPRDYVLSQNYPNPFNPTTEIRFALPRAEKVSLTIYNALGQQVKALVSEYRQPGHHTVTWDAANDAGQKVGSGMYFYVLKAGEFRAVKKMILLK